MQRKLQKLIVILGPTASGKTDLAIKLAKKLKGEIVSADSRQVYKEMDIATAKPLRNQKYLVKGIPHYLINVVYPNEEFNVAIYKKLAVEAIKDIQKRGKLPFLVGGTGLYIQSVVDNIDFPKVPPQKKLREKLEKKTEKELFEIYKKLDPKGAKFIDKENKRRLIRAIEVCKVTKKSFWQQRKKGEPIFDVLQIGIKLPKSELKKRIRKRVERMFKLGLEKETKNLVKKYGFKIPPLQTIGYQEWKELFERKIDKNEVRRKIIFHTLQFARRQMSWFKRDKRIKWVRNYKKAEKLIKNFLENKKEEGKPSFKELFLSNSLLRKNGKQL
jgi:tRNA dimethylallyltransferase